MKTVSERRKLNLQAARRKKKLCKALFDYELNELNRYTKMHIGCGCGLCKPTKRFHYPSYKHARDEYFSDLDLKTWDKELYISLEE